MREEGGEGVREKRRGERRRGGGEGRDKEGM